MPDVHAKVSASGAHRWLNCPPSAEFEKQFPDSGSNYAAEGTLAHSYAELLLTKQFSPMPLSEYKARLAEIKANKLYQTEMDGYVEEYVDRILSICHAFPSTPYVVIEKQVDFSHVVPDGFGTSDTIIIHENQMHVCDLKYGKGVPVYAEDNPQLRLYALGAIREYALLYNIKEIHTHIIQPRLNHYSTETISVMDLNAWAETVKPIAEQASKGEGEFHAGEWCRFCRAKVHCSARAADLLTLEEPMQRQKSGGTLTDEEIGGLLARAEELAAWAGSLKEYAQKQLLDGKPVPGWKLVEGRSNRIIPNIDEAFAKLMAAGFDESMLYTRKPLAVTELDKLVGSQKKLKELLGDSIIKPSGKPTIAPESDKRKAYSQKKLAEMFGETKNQEE